MSLSTTFTNWVFGENDAKTWIINKLGLASLVTAITGFIAWLTDIVIAAMDKITLWIGQIVNMQWSTVDMSSIGTALGVCNTVFPLVETIAIWTGLYTLWAIVLILRWIKLFIPTMAG